MLKARFGINSVEPLVSVASYLFICLIRCISILELN